MNILLVDDDVDSRACVGDFLRELGHNVVENDNGEEGLESFNNGEYHMVMSDIKMPKISGTEFLKILQNFPNREDFDVVLFTGYGDMETAVEALRAGAYDYLNKPINVEELAALVERIAERQALRRENRVLSERFTESVNAATEETRKELSRLRKAYCRMVGIGNIGIFSEPMKMVMQQADNLHIDRSVPVLIEGETGTGKEVIARYIHYGQGDVTLPFIDLNCAAIVAGIFESEMFGYEPGAFTGGSSKGQKGKIDLAQSGTIFLDEIGEIPVELQAKLLRVIQEREYYRVGGLRKIKADVRIICSTNIDLEQRVDQGSFRQDLFYRLNVGRICLPSLRQRKDDILPLARMFLTEFAQEKGKRFSEISKEAAGILLSYNWPGNVRELKNTMEWAVLMWDDELLKPSHLSILQKNKASLTTLVNDGASVIDCKNFSLPSNNLPLEDFINDIITKSLKLKNNNKTEAAKYLGISRRSLYSRIKNLNIE